jgi:hypothetical protein
MTCFINSLICKASSQQKIIIQVLFQRSSSKKSFFNVLESFADHALFNMIFGYHNFAGLLLVLLWRLRIAKEGADGRCASSISSSSSLGEFLMDDPLTLAFGKLVVSLETAFNCWAGPRTELATVAESSNAELCLYCCCCCCCARFRSGDNSWGQSGA